MACPAQYMLSASGCIFLGSSKPQASLVRGAVIGGISGSRPFLLTCSASLSPSPSSPAPAQEDSDCNEEECAPQKEAASSHVVQRCLDVFSPEQADEIVGELLACHHWGFTFQQLITDPYANYVLQSAMRRREKQMHSMLLDTIRAHQSLLRDDRIAREVFRELRRLYR